MADNKVNSGLLEFSEDQKVFVALDAETSEVKKAVTIDGDGVETDIAGGGGGDVTVEALSVTENGTYSEEGKAYSPVTVNVEAAASDFSRAEVTVVNTDEGTYLFFLPFAYSSDNLALVGVQGEVGANETKTFEAILAADGCDFIMEPSFSGSLAVTGDAQKYGSMVAITGDCTITISAANN